MDDATAQEFGGMPKLSGSEEVPVANMDQEQLREDGSTSRENEDLGTREEIGGTSAVEQERRVVVFQDAGSLKESHNGNVSRALQSAVEVLTSKVEQMEQQVVQVTRIRSALRKTKSQSSQAGNYLKEREKEKGNSGSKKQRLLDAARCEAARRRRMGELERQFGNMLRQIMQHKWAWPFMRPVDVEGLQLHDYYRVIRKPMDLGTIRNRVEAKDGSGYRHVREMCEDVRLVFRNAMMYNESWTDVHKMARALSQKFEEKWKALIEPKLLEEEANANEDQHEAYTSEIAELHAGEERAAEKFADDVCLQLTDLERQIEGYIYKVLVNSRIMSDKEKQELSQRLAEVSPCHLNRVVEIVAQHNVAFDATAEKVQIDLEKLDMATLWRLHFYVKMVTNAGEKHQATAPINVKLEQSAGPSDLP